MSLPAQVGCGAPRPGLLPEIARTWVALERDRRGGGLPADADAEAMHAFTVAAYKGYVIFREALARDVGVSVKELDGRFLAVYDRALGAMTGQE